MKHPAVLLPAVEREAVDVVVVRAVVLQDRDVDVRDPQRDAFVADEGHVAVLGQRLPERVAGELRPAPLLPVAVEVAEHDVDEAGAQKRLGVDAVGRALGESLVHRLVIEDLRRAVEAGVRVRRRLRELVEGPDHAGERLAELAERGIVRHDDQPLVLRQHAGGLGDPVGDDRRPGCCAAI